MEGHWKFPGRWGLRGVFLKAKYEAKLKFPEGTGYANQKTFRGEYGSFLELHIDLFVFFFFF